MVDYLDSNDLTTSTQCQQETEETFPTGKMARRIPPGGTQFATQLSAALELRGWTQSQFAKKLKITEGAVSKWVAGVREPPLSMLVLVATALRVSADWLLGVKKAPAPFDERVMWEAVKVMRDSARAHETIAAKIAAALPPDDES